VNEGFELTAPGQYVNANAVQGWTVSSQSNSLCTGSSNWSPGSPEFSIVATPLMSFTVIGTIPQSPLGGSVVAVLNRAFASNYSSTRISQTFPVTSANSLFQFAFAGIYDDGGHLCCEQPSFKVLVKNTQGTIYTCSSVDLSAGGPSCNSGNTFSVTNSLSWTNWQVRNIDLTPYIGTNVTIEAISSDCIYGGHSGSTLFDAKCVSSGPVLPCVCTVTNSAFPVSFCAGSSQAVLQAPLGYATYSWIAPSGQSISSAQATAAVLTVTNPVAGSVFSVMLSTSGCQYVATYTLNYSTVSVHAIGATAACQMNASGSATVVGTGSGTGYNYSWINSTNSVVSTASVASNLVPGMYTVVLSSSAGCGTAAATASVGNSPPMVQNISKPFCAGQPAYLGGVSGIGYQWYNGSNAIAASQGGTAASYTVNSPTNGAVYRLGYVSQQGCRDSLIFTLSQTSSPGGVGIVSTSSTCPGTANGSAVIGLIPAANAPAGYNAFTVFSLGTLTPAYNSSVQASSLNYFTALGLTSGFTYSVKAFDGACYYGTTFSIVPVPAFDYTLVPAGSPTLCNGNSIAASASGVSASQYTYSWSPTQFLVGNQGIYQNTIITPTTAPGIVSSLIYSVMVTSMANGCSLTKTLSITVANPIAPTITPIPALCSNDSALVLNVNPPGGNFITGGNTYISTSGILTPSMAAIGVNTFSYSTSAGTCVAITSSSFVMNMQPSLVVSGNLNLCTGQSTSLTASGATSYNWSNGSSNPSVFLTPAASTTLFLTGNNASCASGTLITISVAPMPTVTVAGNYTICSGNSVTLTAGGATSYTWSNGVTTTSNVVAPGVTTAYTVTGANSIACKQSVSTYVYVGASPSLTVSGGSTICPGQAALLSASGADTYSWSTGALGAILGVTPFSTTSYVVVGTSFVGNCSDSKTITVVVDGCNGIKDVTGNSGTRIYPNPLKEILNLDCAAATHIIIYNTLGMLMLETDFVKGTHTLRTGDWSIGTYFIKATSKDQSEVIKMVKTE
jgi:hypothetical protein